MEEEREIVSGQLGTLGLAPGGEERYPPDLEVACTD